MALGKIPGSSDAADDDELGGVFAEINITPLTDIFLVLLIIFMVTSTVMVNRDTGGGARAGLRVNLPQGGASDVTPRDSDVSIAVLTDGRLVLGGDVVTQEELEHALVEIHRKNPDTLVVVQADEGVPHGRVVQVIEAAKGSGLSQVAIGVRERMR